AALVGTCAAPADAFRPHVGPPTLLTDVGSVKGSLVDALEARWPDPGRVVGGHPIAGSEIAGAAAARGDLFRGRLCILTPTRATQPEALGPGRTLWEGVGARGGGMGAALHDAVLAPGSH